MAVTNVYFAPAANSGNMYGTITIASATQIQITSGNHVQNYIGNNFTYDGESITGGTVTLSNYYENGKKIYEISEGNYSAVTIANLVLSGDTAGLTTYIYAGSDRYNGCSENDIVNTGTGNDQIFGNGGNDSLNGGTGNDTLDGGANTDIAIFSSTRANATLTKTASGWTVSSAADGTDTLTNIERLQFADKKIALDITPDGNAGKALEFIGMLAFNKVTDKAIVGEIVSYFDQLPNMQDICQLVVNAGLTKALAGGDGSNAALAKLVFRNVVGHEASAADVDSLISYMDGRNASMTQTDFLTAIAGIELNQQHIGLVGLQSTGVEYIQYLG